ncbi:hypothetical protein [Sinomonas mesophila]|uniref:putative acetyltransferase n=1 Tax=Sinomonas mesophila TaxID=1531955 RepID=UPI00318321E0
MPDSPAPVPPDAPREAPRDTPPVAALRRLAPGTRVVVRYRIGQGFTDALGDLLSCTADEASVRTRRGDVVVHLADVVAAKPVPPPPPRRAARFGTHDGGPLP